MKKDGCPKFFDFSIIDIIVSVISFIALFKFWGLLTDLEKLFYIIIPFAVVMLIISIIRYCLKVRCFYDKYEELYNKYSALTENYKKNIEELSTQQYNNELLRDFFNRSISLLIIYNDLSEEERLNLKQHLIASFIDVARKEDNTNEKKF